MVDVTEYATPVTIVGGGPVGLVLALFLDFYDVKCTIFNTEPQERWHPKGNGQNARTMEHYRRLGFSDEVRQLGLPGDHPFDQAYFTRLSTHEIFRFPMPTGIERIAMRREMPVTTRCRSRCFTSTRCTWSASCSSARAPEPISTCVSAGRSNWFTQDEKQVRLHARQIDGGEEGTWTAQYAVACDGGRSFIRKTLGIAYEGDVQKKDAYWAGQFVSIHMRIPDLYPKFVGHRRAWMYWAVNPDPHTRGVIIALNGRMNS